MARARDRASGWNDLTWSELEEWASRFEEWSRDVEIHAYFNNDWEVFAIRNALWLKKRLST